MTSFLRYRCLPGGFCCDLFMALVACGFAAESARADAAAAPDGPLAQEAKIGDLIEQMGHEKFVLRERAQEQLQEIGAPALDALTAALLHNDIEIVMRARYLLSSIKVPWTIDTDPPRIVQTMREYETKGEAERHDVMQKLARGGGAPEVRVLCRIVRYDKSLILSRWAALLVVDIARQNRDNAERAAAVRETLGRSQRIAATWLRTFLKHRDAPQQLTQQWQQITLREQELWQAASAQTRYDIVQKLLFQLVDLLETTGRAEDAEPFMQRIVDLQPDDDDSVKKLVQWLSDKDAHRVIHAVAAKYPHIFDADPLLLYSLAHAEVQLGDSATAKQAVTKAQALNPMVSQHHLVVAFGLQERGWFEWAEQEYRIVIRIDGLDNEMAVRATFLLSEMLHDQQHEKKAGDVLGDLVVRMKADPRVKRLVELLEREVGSVRSRMNYFYARHHEMQNDRSRQVEHLDRAVEDDPHDADVLIALYRLPEQSAARKARTFALIRQSIGFFRQQIEADPDSAMPYNQFAWLVGNTLGEIDEDLGKQAIKASHRSLEIRPDAAGYLDTLGRCYYARGDYENAVKFQSEAASLDPHSGLVGRQLELFQKALAESK